jgi:membrane protein YqaA with SNARE-associated domain
MLEHLLQPVADYFIHLGLVGMALIAYLEAIFFPLPPDVVLFANALFKPHSAWLYALVAGVGSGLGAATNYWIGLKGGRKLFHMIFKNQGERLDKIEKLCQKYGVLTVFIIAFTPIPFMIFTMAGGIFELNFVLFFLACLIGRTLRFLTFTSLIVAFGSQIKENIDIFFLLAAVAVGVILFLHRPKKSTEE